MRGWHQHVHIGHVYRRGTRECGHASLEHDRRNMVLQCELADAQQLPPSGEDALQLSHGGSLEHVGNSGTRHDEPGLERQRAALGAEEHVPGANGARLEARAIRTSLQSSSVCTWDVFLRTE